MRYNLPVDEILVTNFGKGYYVLVTWYSGYRYTQRYIGYSKRDAIRDFRESFANDFPNV